MVDITVSSPSNKGIINKKQITNTKAKSKPKPRSKPKLKSKAKTKIKNTSTSSEDISLSSSFKNNYNKDVKENATISNKVEASAVVTATTLNLPGNKIIHTKPLQSQNVSTKLTNQNLKGLEKKLTSNINQNSDLFLPFKSDNIVKVKGQKLNVPFNYKESEKAIKDKGKLLEGHHLISSSNESVDNLSDVSTLNEFYDSIPTYESSILSNTATIPSYEKIKNELDHENQLSLLEISNFEGMNQKLTDPYNSYVAGSNTISDIVSSTTYQNNISCVDLPSYSDISTISSRVISSSNEDILKNMNISTNELIMNDIYSPSQLTLNHEETHFDSGNLLESQLLNSYSFKSNNNSLLLNDHSDINMATNLRSYQELLMNEENHLENNLENTPFSSTSPLNSTSSPFYDNAFGNGNILGVTPYPTDLSNIMTNSKSSFSKVDHELINYDNVIKSETVESVMSSLPECYQEKLSFLHSSQNLLQKVNAPSQILPESDSPALSVQSLYSSSLNSAGLSSSSLDATYYSSSFDSGSLDATASLFKNSLSSKSIVTTENVLSPIVSGSENLILPHNI